MIATCSDVPRIRSLYHFRSQSASPPQWWIFDWKRLYCVGILPDHPDRWTFLASNDFSFVDFDSTLGYPGEGPNWTCKSANIDSMNSHPDIFLWNADVILAQETRISKNNLDFLQKEANQNGKQIFAGALLQERRDINGYLRIPHGGCACLANPSLTRHFTDADDETGLWNTLLNSSRVAAIWHQVLPKVRVLCITFYGNSNISEGDNYKVNDKIIEMIFSLCSQFGDIPIIFSGDFQADPDVYQSIASAKRSGNWHDPLTSLENDGSHSRPITFSRNGNFKNPTDNFSSIDAMILNSISLAALSSIKVCFDGIKAHAPIEASFNWPCVLQEGPTLIKTAPIDISTIVRLNGEIDLDMIEKVADDIWTSKYKDRFKNVDDETAWKYVNQLGIETLIQSGATFQEGLKTRGRLPEFKTKKVFPGQDKSGVASTRESLKLSKVFNLVVELRARFQRKPTNHDDFINTYNLQQKVAKSIASLKMISWWDPKHHLHDDALQIVQSELQNLLTKVKLKEKRKRISAWKNFMAQGTSSKNVSKFVYKWIRNKTQPNCPNLIKNQDGHIITDPQLALDEINHQWDSIFGANALHTDPHEILRVIWPSIQRIRSPTDVPPLDGASLKKQAMRRKIDAAPGIDGWRTAEVRMLPIKVFDAIASYFSDVEAGKRQLPKIMCSVRQVILDKGGEDTPLQKRLISLLPIFMVTYTSLRYSQLASWQAKVMPENLFGGIKGRKLSHLQTGFKLRLDEARSTNAQMIGIKLDKSKCFDRLIPSVSAAIMLALGVPFQVVNMFAKLYSSLRRFLTYQKWTSSTPTTTANGVIQGCSLSLLAINSHMAVWCLLLQQYQEITSAVFIDDCYLFTHLEHVRILQQAMETTSSWDKMIGQVANENKSTAWANTPKGRKTMRSTFSAMKQAHSLEILGSVIQTTQKLAFGWNTAKTQKVLRDIQLIKVLPCHRSIQCHLVGSKVIPQINFSPHLGLIPKDELKTIQNSIVNLIWKNRPKWRSKWLVLGLLAQPFRVDPYIARSYQTVVECVSFLKECSDSQRAIWQMQFEAESVSTTSVISMFRAACTFLDLKIVFPFHFQFRDCEPINFLNFGVRELRFFLQIISRTICYNLASNAARKDISSTDGVVDSQLSLVGHKICKGIFENGIELTSFRDSSITGCAPTNDRRFRAGFAENNICRFCGTECESLYHLVHECISLPCRVSQPELPTECGPNFPLLGIVEVPSSIIKYRLAATSTAQIPVVQWGQEAASDVTHFWTDGSCNHPEFFWICQGGFSIVDKNGHCVKKGVVQHPALCSYSTELWALIFAFCISPYPVVVSTDCDAIVKQTKQLTLTLRIPHSWQHYEWWSFLLAIYKIRLESSNNPLVVRWVPSHLLEQTPIHQISDAEARDAGSNWLDIFCNRKADFFAKQATLENPDFGFSKDKITMIAEWQKWLAKLSSEISAQALSDEPVICNQAVESILHNSKHDNLLPHQITIEHDVVHFKRFLPKWEWDLKLDECDWSTRFLSGNQLRSYANLSQTNWEIITSFLSTLKWKLVDEGLTAYIELSYAFWCTGNRLDQIPENPQDYSKCIRKCINQALKTFSNTPLVPGNQVSKCKSMGKTLPAGCLKGCIPLLSHDSLKHLAFRLLHGRSQYLSDWGGPF